jgi:hypothetical protein
MTDRSLRSHALTLWGLLLAVPAAAPGGGGVEINSFTIDCGGGTLEGATYELTGTIGQPDAGGTLSSAGFDLRGGFWAAAAAGGPPPCPGDTNGDGVVDVIDIVMVILDWGSPDGKGDVNGDGISNVQDLVIVILNWGPCPEPPSGACCLAAAGDCLGDQTQEACASAGGNWQGEDTTCVPNACPQPALGACCVPMAGCSNITDHDCGLAQGNWMGPGTACCSSLGCSIGTPQPCCLVSGCVQLCSTNCQQQGGTLGCDDCESGACCLESGQCIQLNENVCATSGGTFIAGGTCFPDPCGP